MRDAQMMGMETALPLLPAPEATMLEPLMLSRTMSREGGHNRSPQRSELSRTESGDAGMRKGRKSRGNTLLGSNAAVGGDVKELDAGTTWVGPGAVVPSAKGSAATSPSVMSDQSGAPSVKIGRKGISRMRKFVASAQSMLGSAETDGK
jgi:hypothetical protein